MRTGIFITTSFVAFHAWPDAPDEVDFLRDTHRHVFHVRLEFVVSHDDRDLEFFMVKRKVTDYIAHTFSGCDLGPMSCEMLARELCDEFHAAAVEVSEDGENGAWVEVSEDGENGAWVPA